MTLRVHLACVVVSSNVCALSATATAIPIAPLDPFTFESVQIAELNDRVRFTRSLDELSAMRTQGTDPGLIEKSRPLSFSPTPIAIGFSAPVVDEHVQTFVGLGSGTDDDSVRFNVDRNTALNDGGIGGGSITRPGSPGAVSLTQGNGTYNLTDLELQWTTGSDGPVDVVFLSGITAIEAQQVSLGEARDPSEIQRNVVAVPTIGSAVRWEISDSFSFSGQATTQSLDLGSSLLGFQAKTDWRLSDRVGLSAGYQIIRSEFDAGAFTRDLSNEGLFARLQIKF